MCISNGGNVDGCEYRDNKALLMNENRQLDFIDILSILSFVIGLENLEMNITQNDMDAQTRDINSQAQTLVENALSEIHAHLERQDKRILQIMEAMKIETD